MSGHLLRRVLIGVTLVILVVAAILQLSSDVARPGAALGREVNAAAAGGAVDDRKVEKGIVRDPVVDPGAADSRHQPRATVVALERAKHVPVAGLSIRAVRKRQPTVTIKTEADGRAALRPGQYEFSSNDPSVEVLTKHLAVSADRTAILWCARRGRLRLRVVDSHGLPVAHARVSLRALSLGVVTRELGLTDRRGLLEAQEVTAEASARLQVIRDGYYPGQFTLPFVEGGARTVDLILQEDGFKGGIQLLDSGGRPHVGARVTAFTSDLKFSGLPPIVLGRTDHLGRLGLPGDIHEYRMLRVQGGNAYRTEIRNLRIRPGVFEKIIIPARVPATLRTTATGCRWRLVGQPAGPDDADNSVFLIHRFADAGERTEVASVFPEGIQVNVHVWGHGMHGVRKHVEAHGDGFQVFVDLSERERTRTVVLVGQVARIADFSIYSRGEWRSVGLRRRGVDAREVEVPVDSVTCRITSADGVRLAAWARPGNRDTVLKIEFPSRRLVRMRVVDREGQPISNVRVTLHQPGRLPSVRGLPWRVVPYDPARKIALDPRGETQVLMMDGKYKVTLSHLVYKNLVDNWRPLAGEVLNVPAQGTVKIVSLRPRPVKVHVDGPVPRRWNLVAAQHGGAFVTCFGRDAEVWQLGSGLTLEARRTDGTVFAKGVSVRGSTYDHATLLGL